MKILLTGSTGFIGNTFLRKAIAKGHKVGALILPELNIPADIKENENITWLRGTLKEPPWEDIEKFNPEACVHTAWITTPGIYLESPVNYELLRDSVEFIKKTVSISIKYAVVTGTCAEYAPSNLPLNEDSSPINPTSTYARCKHELHLHLIEESKKFGFGICWARIFYPYGPGEPPDKLCSFLIRKFLNNERVYLKYPENIRDYIYIEDIADALLLILEKQFCGTINIGTGVGVSVRQIASLISAYLQKSGLIDLSETSEHDSIVADITKLKSLGWSHKVNIEDGIQRLIKYHTNLPLSKNE
jgi:dTDP-6-deoxy-L-talose 4-dehydrogenase (NAD+)